MQMTFFFFLPSILLSGFMFPFAGMPRPAQWIRRAAAADAFHAADPRDRAARGLGRIDVLVNNAGIQRDGPESIAALPLSILDQTLATNLLGPLALTQAVLPAMRRHDYGRIVNMASSLGAFAHILDPGLTL
jgi:NAD(P)-dependent dehydrogenase (short-subunit alcohol dehydrogenase family)